MATFRKRTSTTTWSAVGLDVICDRKAAEIEIDPLNLAPIFLLEGLADRQLSDDEIDSSAKPTVGIHRKIIGQKKLEPVLGGAD